MVPDTPVLISVPVLYTFPNTLVLRPPDVYAPKTIKSYSDDKSLFNPLNAFIEQWSIVTSTSSADKLSHPATTYLSLSDVNL